MKLVGKLTLFVLPLKSFEIPLECDVIECKLMKCLNLAKKQSIKVIKCSLVNIHIRKGRIEGQVFKLTYVSDTNRVNVTHNNRRINAGE